MPNREERRAAARANRKIAKANGHGPALIVPAFAGVDTRAWSDLPPAAYPPHVIDRVILPRLQAGEDLIRRNAYRCSTCNSLTITYDRHPGITPAFVDHATFGHSCPGQTASLGYPADMPSDLEASHEWYRPSEDELITLTDQAVNHVLNGGLLLRLIPLEQQQEDRHA